MRATGLKFAMVASSACCAVCVALVACGAVDEEPTRDEGPVAFTFTPFAPAGPEAEPPPSRPYAPPPIETLEPLPGAADPEPGTPLPDEPLLHYDEPPSDGPLVGSPAAVPRHEYWSPPPGSRHRPPSRPADGPVTGAARDAWLGAICDLDDEHCGHYLGAPDEPPRLEAMTIPSGETILSTDTDGGSYNRWYFVVVLHPDGRLTKADVGPWQGASGRREEAERGMFPNVDLRKGTMFANFRYRGFGDSGWFTRFEWRHGRFRHTGEWRRDDDCCLVDSGGFPRVWPPERVCAYEWREGGDEVRLFRRIGRVSEATDIRVVSGDCEVYADGMALRCDGTNYTVVTHGDEWVLLSGPERGPTRTELARVPRGCALWP